MKIELKGRAAVKFERVEGTLVTLAEAKKKNKHLRKSDHILLAENFYPTDVPYIFRSKGIISLFGGILSHTSLIAREFRIPAIVGVYDLSEKTQIDKLLNLLNSDYKLVVTMYGNGIIIVSMK